MNALDNTSHQEITLMMKTTSHLQRSQTIIPMTITLDLEMSDQNEESNVEQSPPTSQPKPAKNNQSPPNRQKERKNSLPKQVLSKRGLKRKYVHHDAKKAKIAKTEQSYLVFLACFLSDYRLFRNTKFIFWKSFSPVLTTLVSSRVSRLNYIPVMKFYCLLFMG